ncbi:MAG TPA: hypothetical protein EYQ00_08310 [Dehalococcoidia bacterium]|nr:hypothetical protein [Dehalococcoidia bacterium]
MGEIIILDDYRKKVAALELEDLRQRVDDAMSNIKGMTPEYTYVPGEDVDISLIPSCQPDLCHYWNVPASFYSSYGYYPYEGDDGS